jgi:hypothetical protein
VNPARRHGIKPSRRPTPGRMSPLGRERPLFSRAMIRKRRASCFRPTRRLRWNGSAAQGSSTV